MIRPQHSRKSSLTFSVPSVLVTASDRRPSLGVYDQPNSAGSAGQVSSASSITLFRLCLDSKVTADSDTLLYISPLSLPRPPRCLTPYPETRGFPYSHEPSPLSSPAFSASSLPGSEDEDESVDAEDSEDEEDEKEAQAAEPRAIMSPTTASKAVCPFTMLRIMCENLSDSAESTPRSTARTCSSHVPLELPYRYQVP